MAKDIEIRRSFHGNGQMSEEASYVDDVRDGLTRQYDNEGNLIKEIFYKDGSIEGLMRTFHKNGKVSAEYFYEDGLLEGMAILYAEDGTQVGRMNYAAGKLNGTSVTLHPNGNVSREGEYVDGAPFGDAKYYDESGNLIGEGPFFDKFTLGNYSIAHIEQYKPTYSYKGLKIFSAVVAVVVLLGFGISWIVPMTPFYNPPKEQQVGNEQIGFKKKTAWSLNPGKNPPDGLTKTYYPKGELHGEWEFKNGKQHGKTIKYYRSGQVQSEGNYKNGKLDGWYRVYHETGRLITESFYEDGAIVAKETDRKKLREIDS